MKYQILKFVPLLWFIVCSGKIFSQSTLSIGSTVVQVDTIITGLDIPWEMVYGPDDNLWITERKGIVSRIDPQAKTKTVILDLTAKVFSFTYGECGMLGLALHPDFPAVPEVFVVYNYGILSDLKERLVKFTYSGGLLVNEQILIDSIKGNTGHDGSRLQFLPDKTLLMTTGEAQNGSLAQDLSKLNGKVLRLHTNGTVPADNPYPGSYVFTCGHRNAQGLTLAPNGIIYSSEHGPVNDDEFQIIEKGRNYGWPDVEGFCDLPAEIVYCNANNIKEPLINWTPTIAPGDITWYSNSSFPEWDEQMLLATLKAKKLVVIKLNATGTAYVSQNSYLNDMFGRLRAICIGPKKEIYIATNGPTPENTSPNTHSIIVLKPPFVPTAIGTVTAAKGINVYPTHAHDLLTIESAFTGTLDFVLADISGNSVCEGPIESGSNYLAIDKLSKGMYVLFILKGQEKIQWTKIVKD